MIQNCTLDPNYRTNHPLQQEFLRVDGLKDIVIKKTSKDCVPKTEKLFEKLSTKKDSSLFKRGIMLFDDYNYSNYNKVMPELEELIEEEDSEEESEGNYTQNISGDSSEKSDIKNKELNLYPDKDTLKRHNKVRRPSRSR